MSIADELLELQQNTTALGTARTDIRTALANKGVSASDHDFADFADDVESIPSGGHSLVGNSVIMTSNEAGNKYLMMGNYVLFKPLDTNGNGISLALRNYSQFRFIVKFMPVTSQSNWGWLYGWAYNGHYGQLPVLSLGSLAVAGEGIGTVTAYTTTIGNWYYGVVSFNGTKVVGKIYDADGNFLHKLGENAISAWSYSGSVDNIIFGGGYNGAYDQRLIGTIIDIDECYIETGNTAIWGQTNSKTQNMGLED